MSLVVAVLVVPLSLRAGMWMGSIAARIVLAALPALLIVLVVPPLAVVVAERWLSHREGARSMRTGAALGVALGLQVLVLVGAIWVGASARRFGDVAVLIVVDAVVLSGAVRWVVRRSGPPAISSERRGQA